jgi:hypothetical protein
MIIIGVAIGVILIVVLCGIIGMSSLESRREERRLDPPPHENFPE